MIILAANRDRSPGMSEKGHINLDAKFFVQNRSQTSFATLHMNFPSYI